MGRRNCPIPPCHAVSGLPAACLCLWNDPCLREKRNLEHAGRKLAMRRQAVRDQKSSRIIGVMAPNANIVPKNA
jgi:hypothetical protein